MIGERGASETSQAEQKMTLSTKKRREIARALTLLIPGAPFIDAEPIREIAAKRKFKSLPVSTAIWLAAVAHIRHVHTEYDALLDEGYERDAARHFVLEDINAKLTEWRATRLIDPAEEVEPAGLADEDETG
jgi:hypothetical protein